MTNLSRHGGYPPWAVYSGGAYAPPFFLSSADSRILYKDSLNRCLGFGGREKRHGIVPKIGRLASIFG